MSTVNSVNYILTTQSLNQQMVELDSRVRAANGQRQERVVQNIQQVDLANKQSAVKAREIYLGTQVDVYV